MFYNDLIANLIRVSLNKIYGDDIVIGGVGCPEYALRIGILRAIGFARFCLRQLNRSRRCVSPETKVAGC